MAKCQSLNKRGQPCGNSAWDGSLYCRFHQPKYVPDLLQIYHQIERAYPAEKAEIVLRLIEEHPEGKLELPQIDNIRAELSNIDLSTNTLKARRDQLVPFQRGFDERIPGKKAKSIYQNRIE